MQEETVKVEVHSSSSGAGSDENLSSLDLSERSADPENDYEEIYQPREEKTAVTGVRRSSRDSGSHSRSSSSSNSHVVVETAPAPAQNAAPTQEEPSMTASTDLEPMSMLDNIIRSFEEQEESGVSSGSPSDLGHSEEECEKTRVSHRHSLPHLQHSGGSSRALKRVVSEPGFMCPPPPPPPPPEEEGVSSPSRSPSPPEPEVLEEPSVKLSEVVQSEDTVKRPGSPSAAPSVSEDGDEQRPSPNLVNKQMVLPFIPPRFPSTAADSNSLIKPSEYLRSLGGSRQKAPDEQTEQNNKTETLPVTVASTPSGPPPPPLPAEDSISPSTARKQQQPLGAISIQDLNSVQLRRTDKMMAAKTLSAPPRHTAGDQPFLVQKEDLIAELKMSKDITGIKKMKVERARVEEQQEKQMFTEITRQLTANSFVEKIPEKDATGNPIPAWKRQMMAKKAAERARKELEEQMLKEAEQKRLQSIPPWKRQLLAKKEEHDSRKTNLYTPRVVDDKKAKPSKPEEVLRQQLPSGGEVVSTVEDGNKENKTPQQQEASSKEDSNDEPAQIIPWRAQLRKTNSKLSLLE